MEENPELSFLETLKEVVKDMPEAHASEDNLSQDG